MYLHHNTVGFHDGSNKRIYEECIIGLGLMPDLLSNSIRSSNGIAMG
jgi:hypothetical protein